jgi:hypothetical protein
MLRKKLIKIPIYDRNLMMIESDNIDELRSVFKDTDFNFNDYFTSNDDIYACEIYGNMKVKGLMNACIYVVFNRNNRYSDLTLKEIAHESMHVIHDIYTAIGTTFGNAKLQEQDAYLMGYIFGELAEFMGVNLKINKNE